MYSVFLFLLYNLQNDFSLLQLTGNLQFNFLATKIRPELLICNVFISHPYLSDTCNRLNVSNDHPFQYFENEIKVDYICFKYFFVNRYLVNSVMTIMTTIVISCLNTIWHFFSKISSQRSSFENI